jgi:hypothetical protein
LDWAAAEKTLLICAPVTVELIMCMTVVYLVMPRIFIFMAETRFVLPYLTFLSSFRNWSLLDWGMKYSVVMYLLRKPAGWVKANLVGVFMVVVHLSFSDWIWTIDNNVRWRFLSPNQEWLVLQPGNEPHALIFAVLAVVSFFVLWQLHRKGLVNFHAFLSCYALFWLYHLAKTLILPNPAWTDWGFLTVIYPSYQAVVPKLVVFILCDILDRMLILSIMVYSILKQRNMA